jgi:hypothetical protein
MPCAVEARGATRMGRPPYLGATVLKALTLLGAAWGVGAVAGAGVGTAAAAAPGRRELAATGAGFRFMRMHLDSTALYRYDAAAPVSPAVSNGPGGMPSEGPIPDFHSSSAVSPR